VLGVLGVLWILWRSWSRLWAVARKMIIEAMHRRVVVVLLVFFIILAPSLPFILKTEGNPKSQVQIVLSYSLSLAEVLLSVVAIIVCTASVCSEIERKHVHITDPKPLARWQFLGGKLLGVVVMCAAILFLMSASVYGLVNYLARDRDFSQLSMWEAQKRRNWLKQVREEVLVTRRAVRPPVPQVGEFVEKELQKQIDTGVVDASNPREVSAKRKALTSQIQKFARTAPRMSYMYVEMMGLAPDREEKCYLRFKPKKTNSQADAQLAGQWVFIKPVEPPPGQKSADRQPEVERMFISGRWSSKRYQEIAVPGGVVNPDGRVMLAYVNLQPDTGVQFDPEEGIEMLQRTEGFFPNYYRSLLIIMCHVTVLAALALMTGSAFSFPVASFTVATLFIIGLLTPWVREATGYFFSPGSSQGVTYTIKAIINGAFTGFVYALDAILPHFGKYSPMGNLVTGKSVGWGFVAQAAAVLVFIKGGISMLLAVYIYMRRELARVIV